MQYSSSTPLITEYKKLPKEFPATFQTYVQHYQSNNALHYHDCLEIGLVIKGSGTEMISNQVYSFEENNISVIQSGCIHDSHIHMHSEEEIGSVWKFIFVNPEKMGISYEDFGGFLSDNSDLVSLFHMMYHELEQKSQNYQTVFKSLLSCFLIYAKRVAPSDIPIHTSNLPREMANVIQWIHSSYNETIFISKLAEDCNMSVSSFNRMFKHYFGMAPLTYVNNVRLTMAQHMLLNTDMSILSISTAVGFASLSSFNRLFKKKYDISPRSMRQRTER